MVDLSKSGDGLTIHFDTLQPYIGWVCFSTWPIINLRRRGPGNYILSSLKSVSSSEEFDEMSESVRKCQFEQNWAECRRSLFREQVFYWQCSIAELWNNECVQEYDQTH